MTNRDSQLSVYHVRSLQIGFAVSYGRLFGYSDK